MLDAVPGHLSARGEKERAWEAEDVLLGKDGFFRFARVGVEWAVGGLTAGSASG